MLTLNYVYILALQSTEHCSKTGTNEWNAWKRISIFKRSHRCFPFLFERFWCEGRCIKKRFEPQTKSMREKILVGSHEILKCLQKHLCSRSSHLRRPATFYLAKCYSMVYRLLSNFSFTFLHYVRNTESVVIFADAHLQTHVISLSALKLSEVWNQFAVSNVIWSRESKGFFTVEMCLRKAGIPLNNPSWHSEYG